MKVGFKDWTLIYKTEVYDVTVSVDYEKPTDPLFRHLIKSFLPSVVIDDPFDRPPYLDYEGP